MLKKCVARLLCLAVLCGPMALRTEAAEFLSVLEDLPLMPGLVEVPDAGMVFDGPTGRIIEAFAAGEMTPDAISAFYASTLPQLGWQPVEAGQYRRDNEILRLYVTPAPDGAKGAGARFVLRPAPAQ